MVKKKNNNEIQIAPIFATPVMEVQLDLDLEKLTEFTFQMQNKDKKGDQKTNKGGWHSNSIHEEKHEEFIRLKKEINQYLQIYRSEIFRGMVFKENIVLSTSGMWVNVNEKHHYNEWHIHGNSTLSGTYYIKHDGSKEQGDIIFKHPKNLYIESAHWPEGIIKNTNIVTSGVVNIKPKSNMLLIFPSWLEHKVGNNLKDDTRISLSFNSNIISEKKS